MEFSSFVPLSSPEEIKQLVHTFMQKYDKDQDGCLNEIETSSLLSTIYKRPYKDDKMDKFFSIWDVDNNNKVDVKDIEAIFRQYLLGEKNVTSERKEKAKKKVAYSSQALQRLEVARRLFKMFDKDDSGTMELPEVKLLMAESYKGTGIEFNPTDREAQDFLALIDQNKDGLLHLEDYEAYVLQSLEESGINIHENQLIF